MRHTPSLKLAPLCLALTSCTGLCAPTGTYELFPEDMGTNTPDLRMQDMRGGKDAKMERDMKRAARVEHL